MAKHKLNPSGWVDTYGDLLLNYALQRVPERDVARDLVQDTFMGALKSQDSYRGELSEKNWLFLILRSRILDYFKKKKEVLASDFSAPDEDDEDTSSYFDERGHWLKDKRPQAWSTDAMIQSQEFDETLEGCMRLLKDKQRDAFALKYVEGKDTEEVCKELNISSSNYWVLIHRAKLQLRDCLEQRWLK